MPDTSSKKWPVRSIESISSIVSGVTLGRHPPAGPTRTVPYLTVANVKDGSLALKGVRSVEVTDSELTKWRLEPGDLLLTEGGDPDKLGRGTIWRGEIETCIHQNHIFRVRFRRSDVDPEFAALQVSSPYGKRYFFQHAKQTTGIATINQRVLRAFPFLCPPLSEQQRIARTLTDTLRIVERARAAAEAQLEAARRLRGSYLTAMFDGHEGSAWPRRNIGGIAQIVGGIQKSPSRAPLRFHKPYLTVRNVQRGFLDLSEVERFEVTPEEHTRLRLLPGDLLIVEGNGSIEQIGRNAVFTDESGEWIHQNHVIRVRVPEGVASPIFLSHYLNSELGIRQMIQKAQTTSGLYTLSTGKVADLEVPVPPLADQERALAALERQLESAKRMVTAAEDELSALRSLPAVLLRQAFSGEL